MMGNPIEEMLKQEAGKLPTRPLTNMTPSKLYCFEKTPIEFFLRYLLDVKALGVMTVDLAFVQTRPMAYGSAFDGRVKELLALRDKKRFGYQLEGGKFGLKAMVDKSYHGDMDLLHTSNALAEAFVAGPAGKHLAKHKPVVMEGSPGLVDINGVPMYGKVDIESSEPRILDFKVTGMNSANGQYPEPIYEDGWSYDLRTKEWENLGEGSKYGRSLYEQNPDWATQLVTYDMIRTRGPALNRKSPVGIDQITRHPSGRIYFTHIREEIPCSVKKAVVKRYVDAWKLITKSPLKVLPPDVRGMSVGQLDLLRKQTKRF